MLNAVNLEAIAPREATTTLRHPSIQRALSCVKICTKILNRTVVTPKSLKKKLNALQRGFRTRNLPTSVGAPLNHT